MGEFLQSSFKSYLCGAVPVQNEMVKPSTDLAVCRRERCQGIGATPCGEVADHLYSAGNHVGLSGVGVSTLLTNHTASLFEVAFRNPADGWGLKPAWVFGGFTLRKWFCSPTGESSRRLVINRPLIPLFTSRISRLSRVNPSYNTSWKCLGHAHGHLYPPLRVWCLDGYSRAGVAAPNQHWVGERQNLPESGATGYGSGTVNQLIRNLLSLGGRRALSRLVRVIKKRSASLKSYSAIRWPLSFIEVRPFTYFSNEVCLNTHTTKQNVTNP